MAISQRGFKKNKTKKKKKREKKKKKKFKFKRKNMLPFYILHISLCY